MSRRQRRKATNKQQFNNTHSASGTSSGGAIGNRDLRIQEGRFSVLGLDIGGANIKAALIHCDDGKRVIHKVAARSFEIWKEPGRLALLLQGMVDELGAPDVSKVAVTMTAELSDAFQTKREGVVFLLKAVEGAFKGASISPFGLDGLFMTLDEAYRKPLLCAASNWLASALYLADSFPDCIMIDIGSTSTDIIPIHKGKVINRGSSDPERLRSGELLYSGVLRTNPNTIVHQVPVKGEFYRVAAEHFVCMADVYLILKKIEPRSYSCPTPDGREKNIAAARERLARLICADCEILSKKEIESVACYLWEKHLQQVTESLFQVVSEHEGGFALPILPVGAGAFVAKEVGKRLNMTLIDPELEASSSTITSFPAYAVAHLLAQNQSEVVND